MDFVEQLHVLALTYCTIFNRHAVF